MQEVAIKAPKVSTLNSGAIEDFFREAKTAINFKHENILKCLGISFGNTFSLHTEKEEFSFHYKWYSFSFRGGSRRSMAHFRVYALRGSGWNPVGQQWCEKLQ